MTVICNYRYENVLKAMGLLLMTFVRMHEALCIYRI